MMCVGDNEIRPLNYKNNIKKKHACSNLQQRTSCIWTKVFKLMCYMPQICTQISNHENNGSLLFM